MPEDFDREIAKLIDHTLLGAGTLPEAIEPLCREAATFGFASVCVNGVHVSRAVRALAEAAPLVCTVVGFPLGASVPAVKAMEAELALGEGASEVDMVVDLSALRSGDRTAVRKDIETVREVVHGRGAKLKVILEMGMLAQAEKRAGCLIAAELGVDFVKTSTGFAGSGATVEDVRLMRELVGAEVGVKASGGIRDRATALAMIEAGATRIGASASVAIVGRSDESTLEV
jgi:deoxyribose-phosphate aldolase